MEVLEEVKEKKLINISSNQRVFNWTWQKERYIETNETKYNEKIISRQPFILTFNVSSLSIHAS